MRLRRQALVAINLAIVQYTGANAGSFGHNYFRSNPAVSSDRVLALCYDRDPGGRGLSPVAAIEGRRHNHRRMKA